MSNRVSIVLDFLARHRDNDDIPSLVADFQATLRLLGFDVSAAGGAAGIGRERVTRFFFNDWPVAWMQMYLERGFVDRDPVVLEARRRMQPFQWSEVADSPGFIDGREVIEAAAVHGWIDGLVIPIHGPGGYLAIVSLAAKVPFTLTLEERALIQAFAFFVHERCRRIIDREEAPAKLTPREVECMQWVATGKTDREIATLMGISPATVHFHVENAKKRLGLKSRTQAVALLVLRGIV
ncbi:MAG: LuxR family transcriptional regulator [Rhizobiaceae bacterium]|nr:LuxR family transcriptional regulator [Rhizobiaceae bacterium]